MRGLEGHWRVRIPVPMYMTKERRENRELVWFEGIDGWDHEE